MPSFNKVIVMGNLTRDPEVRQVGANAVKVCRFALALNERRRDRNGNMVDIPTFVEVDAWEKLAELCGQYKELHPEDSGSTLEDVTIRTAKRVLPKGFTNDLGFSVGNKLICLVEAQGYRLKAMNLRTILYLAATFQGYLSEKRISVYEVGDGCIPKWEAYVVSTNGPGEGVYRLDSLGMDLLDGSSLKAMPASEDSLPMEYIKVCRTIDE